MEKIKICLVLDSDISQQNVEDNFLKNYQAVYKPIISFLYSHPNFKFTFSFTGEQLAWYKKNYPEFLNLVSELCNRKQVEVLGGGYYNPIFPLLYPSDSSGQIELMSSELRKSIGKRPRGLLLCASSWEPALISVFQTCGMEYVILDNSLIPPSKQVFLPLIATDKGKSLCVFASFRHFIPNENQDLNEYIENIISTVTKKTKDDVYSSGTIERVVTIILKKHLAKNLLKNNWFEKFLLELQNKYSDLIELSTPQVCRKNASQFVFSHIPAGIASDYACWAKTPYTNVENKEMFPTTIYDFLRTYPRHQALYNRMLYVSMMLNQYHGDKMRKKAAREELWKSQNGKAFICTPDGNVANSMRRLMAYKSLSEAEQLLRESEEFNNSITSFDYNYDGINEYVCRMKHYNACISLKGASIFEFDVMNHSGNYTDNLDRIERFDGYNDNYERGFFVDHLLEKDEFELYKKQNSINTIFSTARYNQVLFNNKRNEISLEAIGYFSALKQPVRLRKNYFITENGFMVQYIIKNESPLALCAKLAIESNFARPDERYCYKLEVVSNGELKELDSQNALPNFENGVSVIQVTDTSNDTQFIFEPNEVSSLEYSQISFMRPGVSDNLVVAGKTFVIALCWDVNLAANMEMEKTINFTIVPRKKSKRNKKIIKNCL